MHFPVLVIRQRILLEAVYHRGIVNDDEGIVAGGFHHQFEDVEQLAGIASAIAQHGVGLAHFYFAFFQHYIRGKGAVKQSQQIVLLQRLQHIELAARQQGADDLERRILRRGTDKGDDALLYGSQQGILLRLGETVYLVNEQDGACRRKEAVALGPFDDLAHILHAAGHGAQGVEGRLQAVGNDLRQSGLSHAGRPPQDEGGNAAGVYHPPQDGPLAHQMLLADVFVQGLRTKSFC